MMLKNAEVKLVRLDMEKMLLHQSYFHENCENAYYFGGKAP